MDNIKADFYKAGVMPFPKWIPVTERLPEWHYSTYYGVKIWDGDTVLVSLKKQESYYRQVGIAMFGPDGWHNEDNGLSPFEILEDVIAWMPLPEPYREEADHAQLD